MSAKRVYNANSYFMELPTDSTTLAGYLEQSAERIAESLRCAEVKNAQKTVKAMVDGVFKNFQAGGKNPELQKADLNKARTALESAVNAMLAAQTETTARLEAWGEKDYEDKALVNAFFELGCKAIAIQMMLNGDKIAVNGRLLNVKCFLDFFRKKSGEASYSVVLDYMETYGTGKDSKEETGNRRSFLRGRPVTLAFFEAIFDTGPDLDLGSDAGKRIFLSSYAQTKKRWPFHSTQWDKAKIHVVNPAGGTEEISARQVLEAWEIRPEQGLRTLH